MKGTVKLLILSLSLALVVGSSYFLYNALIDDADNDRLVIFDDGKNPFSDDSSQNQSEDSVPADVPTNIPNTPADSSDTKDEDLTDDLEEENSTPGASGSEALPQEPENEAGSPAVDEPAPDEPAPDEPAVDEPAPDEPTTPDEPENSQNTPTTDEPEKNVALSPDFLVYDKDGAAVRLSDYFGKPIVLNFWASWCGPCRREMPHFEQMYEKYGNDVEFLMVNLTAGSRESFENATAFISENGYTFPVLYDTAAYAATAYSVYSIPTTYFIYNDGSLAAMVNGAISAETLERGINLIK